MDRRNYLSLEIIGWMLFLVPLITFPLTFNQFEFPKLILFYLFSLVILLTGLIGSIKSGKFTFVKHPGLIALGGFLGLYVLSTLRSINLYTSIFGLYPRVQDGLLLLLCSLIIFFSVLNITYGSDWSNKVRKLLIYAGLAGVLEIIYGGYQYLTQALKFGGEIRVPGLEDHPIYFATFIMVSFFNFWFLAGSAKTKMEKRFWDVGMVLAFWTIAGSLTRSVWISTVLAVGLVVGLGKRKSLWFWVMIIITTAAFFGPAVLTKVNQTIFTPSNQNNLYIRWGELLGVGEVARHNFLLGSGPATLIYAFPKYRPLELNYTQEWDLEVDYARNLYLNYAATVGLPALIFFLLFIGLTVLLAVKQISHLKQDKHTQKLIIILLGAWASLVIQALFYHWTVTSNLYFWSLSGILAGFSVKLKQINFNVRLLKLGLVIICLAGLTMLGRILLADIYYADSLKQADLLSGKNTGYNSYLFFQDHFASGDLSIVDNSIKLLNQSVSLFPFNEGARRQLIYLLLVKAKILQVAGSTGQARSVYSQALSQAEQTIKLNNKNSLNYYFLALTEEQANGQIGDLAKEAVEHMKAATLLDQSNPMMLNNLGLIYLQQGKLVEAESTFKQAIGLKKDLAESYYHLGESLKQQGKALEAIKVYEQVLHFEPANQFVLQEIKKAKDVKISR